MKSRYNPVLIAIIAIGLIVSLWLNYQRHEIEQRNDTVEMAMEYEGLEHIANWEGLSLNDVLAGFKKAGVTSLVVFDTTLEKLNNNGSIVAVTVGRLSAEKNMRLCPEVAAALKNKGINFKWVLIGDGEEKRHISNMIAKYNLGENVIMLGTNKNPYPYIATADVMIHPSLVESQGITILESMVLETPVIAVNSAGPREFIISGINGYLVVPEVDKIVKLIEKIYKDPELREKMVENARETVRRFEPQYIIKQIEEILET